MSDAHAARDTVFLANQSYVKWFGDRIASALPANIPMRILDVGCGDGSLLVHLATALPQASLVGVDISSVNASKAAQHVAERGLQNRVSVLQSDFLELDAGLFDAVVAFTALQFLHGSTAQIAGILARALKRGGRVIHATPYDCPYNRRMNAMRRALRRVRHPVLDAVILAAASVLHPSASASHLRPRVDYVYMPVTHFEDAIRVELEQRGLRLLTSELVPHASIGQLKHRFVVMAAPNDD